MLRPAPLEVEPVRDPREWVAQARDEHDSHGGGIQGKRRRDYRHRGRSGGGGERDGARCHALDERAPPRGRERAALQERGPAMALVAEDWVRDALRDRRTTATRRDERTRDAASRASTDRIQTFTTIMGRQSAQSTRA